jgi:hypothetical protein
MRRRIAIDSASRPPAAQNAGLSERQVKTTVRVANVPAETFEAAVESAALPRMV